jgi:chitinase
VENAWIALFYSEYMSNHRKEMNPMTRRLPQMITVLVVVVAALALTGSSSASYVSSTRSTGTVSAAADWVAPTVAVTSPGAAVRGSTKITATATDDPGSGVKSVTVQRATAGSTTWTDICTVNTVPFACDWVTGSLVDGAYDLRATATDNAGNTATSATTRTTVANSMTVVLARPGDFLRGTFSTTSTVTNAGTLSPTVRVEYAPTGTASWTVLCTATTNPYTCSPSTVPANGTYDFRSVATVGSASGTSATVAGVIVDNANPTVTLADPGTSLKGTKTFTVSASDAHSGVAKVVVQATTGTKTTDVCHIDAPATTCSVDTTTLPNGTYTFRAIATDKAGNVGVSADLAGKVVANTVSTVALTTPSPYVRGNVILTATTTTTGKIANVRFEQSIAGANSWTPINSAATSTTATYTTTWNTSALNGTYDLRAVLTDSDGNTVISNVVANRLVDNLAPKGVDIQTTNGGAAGRIDAGDTIVYTYSEQMDLSSIYAGWSGTATSGSIRVGGLFTNNQVLQIDSPTNVRLGTVDLNAYFAFLGDVTSDATITAATSTADGVARTVVTIKVLGGAGYQVNTAANMVWTPSASATDLAGNPVSTAAVTESGASDVDF